MIKQFSITGMVVALTMGQALAACPAQTAGETAAEIKTNELRIACLQQELANDTHGRSFELELNALDQSLRMLELQQRFNALPAPVVVIPVPVQP